MPIHRTPSSADTAEMMVGVVLRALRSESSERALALARQCADLFPRLPIAHFALARALRANGQPMDAVRACERALSLDPSSQEGTIELGVTQRHAGLFAEAESTYVSGLARWPHGAKLHHNLANLLQRRRSWAQAESHYRSAIEASPHMAEAHVELGSVLHAQGSVHEANQCFAEALAVRPTFEPAWKRLSVSLLAGDPVQGIHELQRGARDSHTSTRILLAVAEAAQHLDPDNVIGLYATGLVLRANAKLTEALVPLERVMKLAPGASLARQSLYIHTLCLMDLGESERAITNAWALSDQAADDSERAKAKHLHALLRFYTGEIQVALPLFREAIALAPRVLPHRVSYCATQLYVQGVGAAEAFGLARSMIGPFGLEVQRLQHSNLPDPNRRLRIGYLSGDLHRHSCAYFLAPLFLHHDQRQFELFAYATEPGEDAVTQRFQTLIPNWRRAASDDDDALARQVQMDGIDILVDLAGLTDGNRVCVMARKPAPVQFNWLGYLGTTGLDAMDGRLTDACVDPTDSPLVPGEVPLRLPRVYVCYEPPDDAPQPNAPPMLQRGYPTFGSFNALSKLSDNCLALWCEVLRALPDARLLIKSKPLRDAKTHELLSRRIESRGIDPTRIALQGWTSDVASHLAAYHEIDVALDSSPFNGVTTTCEASWMGVPVVSLVGSTPPSRQGLTLLSAIGTPDLAVGSERAFVERCVALVQDPHELARRRAGLRSRMLDSPLMDGPGFALAIEAVYRGVWQDWCVASASN